MNPLIEIDITECVIHADEFSGTETGDADHVAVEDCKFHENSKAIRWRATH